ncbi:hypothetical protein [Streptomyces capillispiralis]|uniref:Uncharacterized protein n=1 Tax=Streptomyces capillispiralis TaxID=68182 RepID=A0A561TLJ9_9ACTN|nr:hypothetical protein [Streptomyces capillispiralis]TWF87920.1 hypothetical protein FHX78_114938 [Streptomyces capillispiralis]GHH94988.1 hypothetical protein GCM10017779_54450 [Streptomyces capillispiralis]
MADTIQDAFPAFTARGACKYLQGSAARLVTFRRADLASIRETQFRKTREWPEEREFR